MKRHWSGRVIVWSHQQKCRRLGASSHHRNNARFSGRQGVRYRIIKIKFHYIFKLVRQFLHVDKCQVSEWSEWRDIELGKPFLGIKHKKNSLGITFSWYKTQEECKEQEEDILSLFRHAALRRVTSSQCCPLFGHGQQRNTRRPSTLLSVLTWNFWCFIPRFLLGIETPGIIYPDFVDCRFSNQVCL